MAVVLLVMSFGLVALMKVELMPAMDEGTISVAAAFRSGTKAEEVDKKCRRSRLWWLPMRMWTAIP